MDALPIATLAPGQPLDATSPAVLRYLELGGDRDAAAALDFLGEYYLENGVPHPVVDLKARAGKLAPAACASGSQAWERKAMNWSAWEGVPLVGEVGAAHSFAKHLGATSLHYAFLPSAGVSTLALWVAWPGKVAGVVVGTKVRAADGLEARRLVRHMVAHAVGLDGSHAQPEPTTEIMSLGMIWPRKADTYPRQRAPVMLRSCCRTVAGESAIRSAGSDPARIRAIHQAVVDANHLYGGSTGNLVAIDQVHPKVESAVLGRLIESGIDELFVVGQSVPADDGAKVALTEGRLKAWYAKARDDSGGEAPSVELLAKTARAVLADRRGTLLALEMFTNTSGGPGTTEPLQELLDLERRAHRQISVDGDKPRSRQKVRP